MAFTLVTNQTIIARNAAGLYGVAVGTTDMASFADLAAKLTGGTDALLNQVYTASVGSASVKSVADTLVPPLSVGPTGLSCVQVATDVILVLDSWTVAPAMGTALDLVASALSLLDTYNLIRYLFFFKFQESCL